MNNHEFIVNSRKIIARQCKKSDYGFIFKIVKKMIFPFVGQYFKPNKKIFDERFDKDYKERVILTAGKRRIGFYQLTPEKDCLHVTGIFLSEAYQGRHIGSYFMKYFETLGFNTIRLQVWENNPAYNFYKKLDYHLLSKENHKYLMEKKLF